MEEKKFKAVLVGVEYSSIPYDITVSMNELKGLAQACDIECAMQVIQKLDTIHPKSYVGTGKVSEIRSYVTQCDANLVIVNEELTPSQLQTLETEIGVEVCDRTFLILEIFSRRAKTKEAVLQVKMARLQYLLPRLIGMNTGIYSQQGGSGFRGSGEKKLELDRRRIKKELSSTAKELNEMVKQRQVQRGRRKKNEIPVIALVGYTNSGKSTLMNQLLACSNKVDKQVFAKDMLFATLETSTRQIELRHGEKILVSDTVGFVDQLPHTLVKAFRSTLEEVCEADLLLHVVDASNPHYETQQKVTNQVLRELGAEHIPMLYIYNKMDICEQVLVANQENTIYMSATKKENIPELLEKIEYLIFADYEVYQFEIPYEQTKLFSHLKELGAIQQFHETEMGYKVDAFLTKMQWETIKNQL